MPNNTDLLGTLEVNPTTKKISGVVRHGQVQTKPGIPATAIASMPGSRDNDMIAAAASATATNDQDLEVQTDPTETETPTATSDSSLAPVETVAENRTLPGWTQESLVAEMKKAREEAKRSRLEKNDAIDRLKAEYDRKLEEIKLATKPFEDTAKELADLKAKEADAKKTLTERLSDRETQLSETKAEIARLKDSHHRELFNLKAEMEKYQTEVNVQNQFYQEKLTEELNLIPDKYKDVANRLMKGCDSTREQLEVLRDAKDRGLFKEKQAVVSHAVPNLEQNARISSAASKTEDQERKKKMKSTDKIGEALKTMNSNPIFRGKRN
jgi:chromosome segregation ATPase